MSELDKFPALSDSSQFVKYIDRHEIQGLIGSLGHTIGQKYKGQELILIATLKGSAVFLADLVREIRGVKLQVDFFKVSSVGRDQDEGTIIIEKDLSTNIFNRSVIIVEEIIDSARAVHFLQQRVKMAAPKSLEIITLLDKPFKRKAPIEADFIGKKIEDQFLVGLGLDLEEYGRNLQDIYFLKYPN